MFVRLQVVTWMLPCILFAILHLFCFNCLAWAMVRGSYVRGSYVPFQSAYDLRFTNSSVSDSLNAKYTNFLVILCRFLVVKACKLTFARRTVY